MMKYLISLMLCLAFCVSAYSQEPPVDDTAVRAANENSRQHLTAGRLTEAMEAAERAYVLGQQVYGPNSPDTAILALNYGQFLAEVGANGYAIDVLERTLAMNESLYGPDAIELVPVLVTLGEVLNRKRQVWNAERALKIQKTARPDDQLAYAKVAERTGAYLAFNTDSDANAGPILNEALAIYSAQYGKADEKLIPVLMSLGDAHAKWFSPARQIGYYQRALKIAKASGDDIRYADILLTSGLHLMQLSGSPKSGNYIKKAHKAYLKSLGPEHVKTAVASLTLARFELATNRPKRAEPLLLGTLEIFSRNSDFRNYELKALGLLVQVYEETNRSDEATPYCRAIGQISPWTDNQSAVPLFKRAPVYPNTAAMFGIEGYVTVEYTVDEDGFVRSPEVIAYDGDKSLIRAALDAVKEFRYAPRYANGTAVATTGVQNQFTFELAN